jgi:hypothetical protein
MKRNSFFITFTYPLNPSSGFVLLEESRKEMSWYPPSLSPSDLLSHRGMVDVFIHQKKTDPAPVESISS